MKVNIEKSVTVITPTIGSPELLDAVESVRFQSYKNVKHLLVIDGQEHMSKVSDLGIQAGGNTQVSVLYENTGANGLNGQRIYAGFPQLINTDYICFLDEDNWYDNFHVARLIELIEEKNYDWAYSLRNIYTKEKQFVASDCCESLGRWPIYWSIGQEHNQYIIDTSAYCFKKNFLTRVAHIWNHGGWGEDRHFYHVLTKVIKHDNYGTTGEHTLNYRLDDKIQHKYGDLDFFIKGNEVIKQHYGGYPWQQKT